MPSQILSINRDDLEELSQLHQGNATGFLAKEDKNIYGKRRYCRKCNAGLCWDNNDDTCRPCQGKTMILTGIKRSSRGPSKHIVRYDTPERQKYLDLLKEICRHFNVPTSRIIEERWLRGQEIYPKQVLVFMLHEDLNFSYAQITRILHFSSNSGITNFCRRGELLFKTNEQIRDFVIKTRITLLKK